MEVACVLLKKKKKIEVFTALCVVRLSLCEGCAVKRAWPSKPNISLPSRVRETAEHEIFFIFTRQPALRARYIFLSFFLRLWKRLSVHYPNELLVSVLCCFFFSESKTSRRIERLAADSKQRKEMGCDGWVNVTEVFYFCVWKTSHETEQLPCTYVCVCGLSSMSF